MCRNEQYERLNRHVTMLIHVVKGRDEPWTGEMERRVANMPHFIRMAEGSRL